MANITLRVDDDLVREAKILAARRGTSVSRLIAEELEGLVRSERRYDAARARALGRLTNATDLEWTAPRSRAELHDR